MRKNKSGYFVLSIIFCALILMINPAHAKAGTAKQSDTSAYRSVFDASYYYNTYPDLAQAIGMNKDALFSHFVTFGIKEGRNCSEEFNPQAYRERYEDLQSAFGNNMAAYCRHYIQFGKAEGRNGRFDGQFCVPAVSGNTEEVKTQPAQQEKQGIAKAGIGTYTTRYDASVPRAKNVALAAQRINGVVVQPGSSFSFSKTILPRTSSNGYVEAPIFISGKVGTGIGGGVCQVSSTLYAAMVDAGLPATERHAHSLPVDYLPKGLDATIAGNSLDLKFTNTFSQPLLIQAAADGGKLTVTLVLQ